ncbi:hypothetical protein [Halomicrobium katesii]|uniref:hypothetical protein n=1 Tax=Halomicrobium katesii TaxID=437163 RepID=UPI00035E698D|nr:hypothetical protein [Halomicrobium katesii]
MIEITLTDREKSIVAVTAAASFVIGFWAGLWSVPVQALDIPIKTAFENGETVYTAAYRPVPTSLPYVTIFVPLLAIAYVYRDRLLDEEPDSTEVPADD